MRGVYALNLCYEWGCTSGAYAQEDSISLLRVLDWPFPALGKHMVVAHQSGAAGDFYHVTWPGIAGVFNAMAPGRQIALGEVQVGAAHAAAAHPHPDLARPGQRLGPP